MVESAKMAAAVPALPSTAHGDAAAAPMWATRMQPTATTLAPEVMPMTSGLARGFLSMVWKVLPATPKANPASTPAARRGRRTSQMA